MVAPATAPMVWLGIMQLLVFPTWLQHCSSGTILAAVPACYNSESADSHEPIPAHQDLFKAVALVFALYSKELLSSTRIVPKLLPLLPPLIGALDLFWTTQLLLGRLDGYELPLFSGPDHQK